MLGFGTYIYVDDADRCAFIRRTGNDIFAELAEIGGGDDAILQS